MKKNTHFMPISVSSLLLTSILGACSMPTEKISEQNQSVNTTKTTVTRSQSDDTLQAEEINRKKSEYRHKQEAERAMAISNSISKVPPAAAPAEIYSSQFKQYSNNSIYSDGLTTYKPAYDYTNIQNNEKYAYYSPNRVIKTVEQPVSTFSIDVDTGSYSNMRRLLNSGHLPLADAIRAEELINYFNYEYPINTNNRQPFTVHTETGPNPWAKDRTLLKIGIRAVDIEQNLLPAANLVFLIDISGSMQSASKLGLLKKSLALLVNKLRHQDSISIVVYAGGSGVVLQPTHGDQHQTILTAINTLRAGGSTNGAAGIELAYQLAQQAYIKDGINRILLATDGDFNVGTVDFQQLKELVANKRKTGISLSTLGFGTGNYNDHLMEQLADAANGHYSYIDTLNEARKVLVDEMASSLRTVASDTKIQVEFNPAWVKEYRLIGYENRVLNSEDFNNDKVDAGDIGAGKTVTALYDIVLKGQHEQIDELRYRQAASSAAIQDIPTLHKELAYVKIRYKKPGDSVSQLLTQPVLSSSLEEKLQSNSIDFRFSASVAAFADMLKGGRYINNFDYDAIIRLARSSIGHDNYGYRHEFINLVRLVKQLQQSTSAKRVNTTESRSLTTKAGS